MEYNYAVFIGRFQPLHKSHLAVIHQGLREAKELILVIGSARSARNIKNPWTFDERKAMILSCLSESDQKRVHFVPARDHFYSDNMWVTEVQQRVNNITNGDESICLLGTYKDSSSYYIKLYPQWDFLPADNHTVMNATDIRRAYLRKPGANRLQDFKYIGSSCPEPVYNYLLEVFAKTPDYANLVEEFEIIKSYQDSWSNVPYPVSFNTTDAVVIQSGHILVVRRKFHPGKGLIALPGGFLKQSETLEACAIRELKEETGIKVDKIVLKNHIAASKTFDHPNRSLRGRTITHAFCIRLPDGPLPEVRGSDDADKAFWMPLMDVMRLENEFYEDHAHIINYFVNRF